MSSPLVSSGVGGYVLCGLCSFMRDWSTAEITHLGQLTSPHRHQQNSCRDETCWFIRRTVKTSVESHGRGVLAERNEFRHREAGLDQQHSIAALSSYLHTLFLDAEPQQHGGDFGFSSGCRSHSGTPREASPPLLNGRTTVEGEIGEQSVWWCVA